MIISFSEYLVKNMVALAQPIQTYLRKNPVYIYRVGGARTSSYFLSKETAYSQMEMIQATANSELNSRQIEREDYHDLDNRLDRLILTDGTIFEISQHRILW
ncbi:hypothetical protein VoSk93_05460 [Vibrio owensii]